MFFKRILTKGRSLMTLLITCTLLASSFVLPSNAFAAGEGGITINNFSLNDGTPLILEADPKSNIDVPLDGIIKITFCKNITGTKISPATGLANTQHIMLEKIIDETKTENVGISVNMPNIPNATIAPDKTLEANTQYRLTVKAGITSNNLADWTKGDIVIGFTTKDIPQPAPAAPNFAAAVYLGNTLILKGLPANATTLEYRISENGVDFDYPLDTDWPDLTLNGSEAVVNDIKLSVGISKVEVRYSASGKIPAGEATIQTVSSSLGEEVPMIQDTELFFEKGITVIPTSLNVSGDSADTVSVRDAALEVPRNHYDPETHNFEIISMLSFVRLKNAGGVYGFSFKGAQTEKENEATISIPVQADCGSNVGVYLLDLSKYDKSVDRGEPIWVYQDTDTSELATKHIVKVKANFNGNSDIIYGVFRDDCIPEGIDIVLKSKTANSINLELRAVDESPITKIVVTRTNSRDDSTKTFEVKDISFLGLASYRAELTDTDVEPGVYYKYKVDTAYDIYGNISNYMHPVRCETIDSDADIVAKMKQDLQNGTNYMDVNFAPGDSADCVTQDFMVPINGEISNSQVEWAVESEHPGVVNIGSGVAYVTKPACDSETDVTLKATIKYGSTSDTLDIPIKVKWLPEAHIGSINGTDAAERVFTQFLNALTVDGVKTIIVDYPIRFIYSLAPEEIDLHGKTVKAGSYFNEYPEEHIRMFDTDAQGQQIRIANGTIDGNINTYGGYILQAKEKATVTFDNVNFINMDKWSYVIGANLDTNLNVINSTFTAAKNASIFGNGGNVFISNSSINGEGKPGYAVVNNNGDVLISNSTITGLKGAQSDGSASAAMSVNGGKNTNIYGNTINDCDNGVIVLTAANNQLNNITITDNTSAAVAGESVLNNNVVNIADENGYTLDIRTLRDNNVLYQQKEDTLNDQTASPIWTNKKLSSSNINEDSLTLSWTPAEDSSGVTSYNIYCGGKFLANVAGNTTTYNVTGLKGAAKYLFKVEAGNAMGKWSVDGPMLTETTAPVTPPSWPAGSKVEVVDYDESSAILKWTPAYDSKGVRGYLLYINDQPWSLGETPDILTTKAIRLKPNTEYTFRIEALDTERTIDEKNYTSSGGPSVTITTKDGIPTPWTVCSKLYADNITETSMRLYWDGSISCTGADVAFKLYCNGEEIKTIDINDSKLMKRSGIYGGLEFYYDITGLTRGTKYNFKVEKQESYDLKWTTDGPSATVRTLPILTSPSLTADATDNRVNKAIEITFADDAEWRNSISSILVDGNVLEEAAYKISEGKITINENVFTAAKNYTITVKGIGYEDSNVNQVILLPAPKPQPQPQPDPKPEIKPEPQSKPETKPEPQSKPEVKPQPETKPEVKPQPQQQPKQVVVVENNFNNNAIHSTPTGWSVVKKGGSVTVEKSSGNSNEKVLKIDKKYNNRELSATMAFVSQHDTVNIEAKFNLSNTSSTKRFVLQNSKGVEVVRISFDGNYIKASNGKYVTSMQRIVPGKWYDLKLKLNIHTGKYDLYINNVLIKSNLQVKNKVSEVSKVKAQIPSRSKGTMYIDSMKVYK